MHMNFRKAVTSEKEKNKVEERYERGFTCV